MLPTQIRPPAPKNHLYRLTVQVKGLTADVYSMASSIDLAFERYLERLTRQHERISGVVLVHGERADPHA